MFFHPLNILTIIIYLVSIAFIGYYTGKEESTTTDFFLASRKMPWPAVCLSILATELSAVTFIGAPAFSFNAGGNFTYLQLALGSLIGRILIATLFLTVFYKHNVTTVYEYLSIRFGTQSQVLGAVVFFITRLLASGVRLYVASLAIHVIFGISLFASIVITSGIAMLYTMWGGIKAVIWTDVLQISIFMGGALATMILIFHYCGGWAHIQPLITSSKKLQVFDFSLSMTKPFTLLAGIFGGCFLTFSALGTDQDLTQRMLTCKNTRFAQKALILTGLLNFPIVIIFLSIGILLYAYYLLFPDMSLPENGDHIFPYFIRNSLPPGISGLLVVSMFAAAMSSLDSALNSLASSAINDIYRPFFVKNKTEQHYVNMSRIFVIFFSMMLVAIAYICKNMETVLILAFKITSYTYGALLGVFLTGILTKRGNNIGNLIAILSSFVIVYCISKTAIAWPWYVVAGSISTFVIAILFPSPKPQ